MGAPLAGHTGRSASRSSAALLRAQQPPGGTSGSRSTFSSSRSGEGGANRWTVTSAEGRSGTQTWTVPQPPTDAPRGCHSPFSRCWKEGENSLAVILAMRASSWAFCAAVRAASALARECEVLAGRGGEGRKGSSSERGPVAPRSPPLVHSADTPPPARLGVSACPRSRAQGTPWQGPGPKRRGRPA